MRSRSDKRPSGRARKRAPWWGQGLPPHERWPGVTIEIPVRWSKARWRWESPDGRFYFDQEAADKACDFFPTFLVHHKGEFAGKPFELLPYQHAILRSIFGWKRSSDGLRRFRKTFVAVPKGNGKSPFGAGIGLLLLLCDGEEGAEVYSAAADRAQAAIVFDTARLMVENSEDLGSMCEVYRRAIAVPATNSSYKVLSADVSTKHGFNIHGLIFDEFHAQRDRELFEALHRGMVKRRQPVLFMITTAGDDDESICYEEWDYARKVQSGTIPDETYLPFIFEARPDDDWKDARTWRRVNPGFGITVKADAIENEARAAANEPRKLNDFLRYHLNRWVNQATAWIPVDWWDACTGEPTWTADLAVAAGLDLAQKIDLAAFAVVVRHPLAPSELPEELAIQIDEAERAQTVTLSLNFRLSIFPFFWMPEDTAREREHDDGVPYRLWASQGLVTLTPGVTIDDGRIYDDITRKIAPRFGLKGRRLGYDPAFATSIASRLGEAGFQMVEVLQNYKQLNEPSQVFYALTKAKRVAHAGHRLLRWNVENVAVKQDQAGRIRPVKPRKSNKRIDGVVASIMAVDQLIREPWPTASVYTRREPFVVSAFGGDEDTARAAEEGPHGQP